MLRHLLQLMFLKIIESEVAELVVAICDAYVAVDVNGLIEA